MKKQTETTTATLGEQVVYVMPNGDYRPAVVVNVVSDGYVNLQVFTDGSNDLLGLPPNYNGDAREGIKRGLLWVTTVGHDQEQKPPNTWHAV